MTEAKKKAPEPFDLDAIEVEGNDDTFPVTAAGKTFAMRDPKELDWRVLARANRDPEGFMDAAVVEDDRDVFKSISIPVKKLEPLMAAYFRNFGIDPTKLNASSGS